MQSKSAVATLHNPEGNYAIIESKWPICKSQSCVERAEQDIGIAPCLVDRLKCKIVQTILVNCCAHDSLQFHTVAIIPIDRHFCTTLHHCPVPGRSYLFRVPAHNITTQCVLQRAALYGPAKGRPPLYCNCSTLCVHRATDNDLEILIMIQFSPSGLTSNSRAFSW